MSQENVEIVRSWFEAYEREDHDGWKALLASDVEFLPLGLMGGSTSGVDNVARSISEFAGTFDSYSVSPEAFYEGGDQVVVAFHRSARSARSPASLEDQFAQWLTLRDGRIVRMQSFRRVHDALEAAGLRG
jgi:ketosteroid isomerase-like protein